MGAGKQYRLSRLFGSDGRAMIVPVDHGLTFGRIEGLERVADVVDDALAAGCDGLLMSLGVTRATAVSRAQHGSPAALLTMDTRFGAAPGSPGSATMLTSVAQAARLGCDAAKILMPWDNPADEQALTAGMIGQVVREAEDWDMPVIVEPLAMSAPRGPETTALELDGARIAVELGADIVKLSYPGDPETLSRLREELGVPLVLLGGPGANTTEALIRMVAEAIGAGASGIAIGRQVWQRPSTVRRELMGALVSLVHGTIDVDTAIGRVAAASK
jgi:class I fructose-bisphosphate aldolase